MSADRRNRKLPPGDLPVYRIALGVLLGALAFPLLAADPPKCKLVRIVEWPVQFHRGLPVIEGSINGNKIGVLLDTGAFASLLTKTAAEKLGLYARSTQEVLLGIGGKSRMLVAWIDELRVGGAIRKGIRVRVGGERPLPGVDFILGDDFFKELDVEFDYAKGVVRLFQPLNCKGVSLAYWDSNALQLPMEDETGIVVPIKVNGRAARAMLDSGASSSLVDLSLAAKVGITPETAGVAPSGCTHGIGADAVPSWVARFDTVQLAGQTIRDPRLRIADRLAERAYGLDVPPEVILGTDFLRAHRVLVSRSQRTVYFSYIGGQIFPATPTLECDDRLKGKSATEARAAYDQAIAKNSGDTKALLHRAALRARQDDGNGALSDLDNVIRVEPGNAAALSLRSHVRAMLKNYEGALADSAAAIANGMRTAQMYVIRAMLRRAQGDHAQAINEYDEALILDPRHQGALGGRGRHLFYAGRFEAAESDFAVLLATRPNGYDSIWLSLSRTRRGLDGNAVLEEGLARLKDGEWPAPILKYLLGRLTREDLMIAMANSDEKKRKSQECEGRFFMAARLIADGQSSAARPLLEKARDECPRNYIEYEAALVELAKLQ
jgi:predicted aspartyl protease/tetratricopeptide (TPR) repeat protein